MKSRVIKHNNQVRIKRKIKDIQKSSKVHWRPGTADVEFLFYQEYQRRYKKKIYNFYGKKFRSTKLANIYGMIIFRRKLRYDNKRND